MRVNGTPRDRADLVAARVQALLSADAQDGDAPDSDAPDTAAPVDVWGDEGTEILPAGGVLPTRADRRRRERADPGRWERLAARVPVRLDPGRRGALAVGAAVVVAALATGAWLVSNRPQAVPVSASAPSVPGAGPLVGTDGVTEGASPSGSSPAVTTASGTATTQLVIDVAGKVRHPGVYRLPSGSRVDDAVRAAGGARGHADLSSLNLAALLVDGQQVSVGVPPAAGGGAVAGAGGAVGDTASGGPPATVVDLNTATLEQLETLPRVGPVLGQDILDYRDAHGSFTSIDQLKDVSGIGDVTFSDLQSLVSV